MKRIILGFLFFFMFCGSVYSQDWGKYWEVIPNKHEFGMMTIEKKNNNQYNVLLHYMEDKRERYPLDCGETLKTYEGKEVNNELILYRNNQERFRIIKNGKFIKVIPNLSGKNVFYCGDSKYEKKIIKNDFEEFRNILKNSFDNIKWKETN